MNKDILKALLVRPDVSVRDAISAIDRSKRQVVLDVLMASYNPVMA